MIVPRIIPRASQRIIERVETKRASLPLFLKLRTAQNWADLVGVTPDHLWLMEETSGTLADSIGSFPLTDNGAVAPLYRVDSGWSSYGMSAADGDNTQMRRMPTTDLDYDEVTSFANVEIVIINATPAALRGIWGKGGGSPRYTATLDTSRHVGANIHDGTNQYDVDIPFAHPIGLAFPVLKWVDRAAGELGIRTPFGVDTLDISAAGSLVSTGAFQMFQGQQASAPCTHVLHAQWSGTEAEGMNTGEIMTRLSRGLTPVTL